jgi:predicted TIM-barrel fold metal-dependent hydrolase
VINKMFNQFSRRKFLGTAGATTLLSSARGFGAYAPSLNNSASDGVPASGGKGRIVDMHVHFDPKKPNYIEDFLKVSERLNLTALMLTPFENRAVVAEAAKQHPMKIIPFGYVNLDSPDVVQQVEELHSMGFRGLGELEFVKKPYIDPSYFPVYERANEYGWVVLFHTGIVLRAKFNEPEDVASGRMRPIHLEEIARRFPKITVLGAHCGNPEYQWAAEIARWNSNLFFDLSGSSLTKMQRQGVVVRGQVPGRRTRLGQERILISPAIVGGNSGGPVLDSRNRVIGLAATGADKFENITKTVDYGVIPIESLKALT